MSYATIKICYFRQVIFLIWFYLQDATQPQRAGETYALFRFYKKTISHQNGIEWNYYNSDMHTESILLANTSSRFIRDYFHNGCKELPLLLDPVESANYLQSYFVSGCKESILALRTDNRYALPEESTMLQQRRKSVTFALVGQNFKLLSLFTSYVSSLNT